MKDAKELACSIVDMFEELLCEKDIVVPCSDEDEEEERYDESGELLANLYGMEYWGLVDRIEAALEDFDS